MPYKDPEKYREYHKNYNKKNFDKLRAQQQEYRQQNYDEIKARNREYRQRIKVEIIAHYCGGEPIKCALCPETRLGALNVDHINGGGKQHREELGRPGGSEFYLWLRKQNYPDGFRVLCPNCNWRAYLAGVRANLSSHPRAINSRRLFLSAKTAFMAALGGVCTVCGTDDIDVLTCHHKNGGGKVHRRENASSEGARDFYLTINRIGDYSGLECRCLSCNDEEEFRGELREIVTPLGDQMGG